MSHQRGELGARPQLALVFERDAKKSLFSPVRPRRTKTRLSPCGVLASFRPATCRRASLGCRNHGGAFPFAKIHSRGERPTRSAVCTSSALHSLRPCWTNFFSILLKVWGRPGRRRGDDCQNTVAELSSVIFRRSC